MSRLSATIPSQGGGTVRHTVATSTATAITSTPCTTATIKSLSTNTANIYLGFSAAGAAANLGYELTPGESVVIDIKNLALIYCLSTSASQYLTILYLTS